MLKLVFLVLIIQSAFATPASNDIKLKLGAQQSVEGSQNNTPSKPSGISTIQDFSSEEIPLPHPAVQPPLEQNDSFDPEAEDRTCRDSYKTTACVYYKRRGLCKRVSFQRKCKQTCTKCQVEGVTSTPTPAPARSTECKDASTSCKRWAKKGYCKTTKHFAYMSNNCKETCQLCRRDSIFATTVLPSSAERYYGECGKPKIALRYLFSHRIVGGSPSFYGTSPWQVGIYNSKGSNICGGVLIGKQEILTAAHCFKENNNVDSFTVYLGKYHRKISTTDIGEKVMKISRIIMHEKYDIIPNANDIAIIKLTKPVTFTNFIRPICLPTISTSYKADRTGLVTGWGETKDASNRNDVLQQVDVKLISNSMCNKWMSIVTMETDNITDDMFCAGYKIGGKDACQGDSGGPLIIQDPTSGRHVLAGIVSWGFGCAKRNRPGVYTKVQNYLNWIKLNSK